AGSSQAGTGAAGGAGGAQSGGSAGGPAGGAGGSPSDAGADAHPCVDTASDPYNCGSCGRVCPNPQGSCIEGRCGPALTDCVQYPKFTPPFPTCNSACQDQGLKCVQGGCSREGSPNLTSVEYQGSCSEDDLIHYTHNEPCNRPVGGVNERSYFRCCCEE